MTDLFNLITTYLHEVFVIKFDGWVILGFVAQGLFTMRFVVQWIASERARKSVIPFGFWECSALGSMLMLSYFAIYQRDSVGVISTAMPSLRSKGTLPTPPATITASKDAVFGSAIRWRTSSNPLTRPCSCRTAATSRPNSNRTPRT